LQEQARAWWANERAKFHLVTSQLTITEASDGDPTAAAERLKLLDGMELVPLGPDVDNLVELLLQKHLMPQNASADAAHVAAAAIAGVNYLLTLNCKHITNAHELPRVYRLLDELGYGQLLICTPNEFLGVDDNDVEESHP
jgi:predicted nucleic acid-binding protein